MDKPWELSNEEILKQVAESLKNPPILPKTDKEWADEDAKDGYINDYDN